MSFSRAPIKRFNDSKQTEKSVGSLKDQQSSRNEKRSPNVTRNRSAVRSGKCFGDTDSPKPRPSSVRSPWRSPGAVTPRAASLSSVSLPSPPPPPPPAAGPLPHKSAPPSPQSSSSKGTSPAPDTAPTATTAGSDQDGVKDTEETITGIEDLTEGSLDAESVCSTVSSDSQKEVANGFSSFQRPKPHSPSRERRSIDEREDVLEQREKRRKISSAKDEKKSAAEMFSNRQHITLRPGTPPLEREISDVKSSSQKSDEAEQPDVHEFDCFAESDQKKQVTDIAAVLNDLVGEHEKVKKKLAKALKAKSELEAKIRDGSSGSARATARSVAVEKRLRAQLDKMAAKLDKMAAQEDKMAAQENKMAAQLQALSSEKRRNEQLQEQTSVLRQELQQANEIIKDLETKLDEQREMSQKMRETVKTNQDQIQNMIVERCGLLREYTEMKNKTDTEIEMIECEMETRLHLVNNRLQEEIEMSERLREQNLRLHNELLEVGRRGAVELSDRGVQAGGRPPSPSTTLPSDAATFTADRSSSCWRSQDTPEPFLEESGEEDDDDNCYARRAHSGHNRHETEDASEEQRAAAAGRRRRRGRVGVLGAGRGRGRGLSLSETAMEGCPTPTPPGAASEEEEGEARTVWQRIPRPLPSEESSANTSDVSAYECRDQEMKSAQESMKNKDKEFSEALEEEMLKIEAQKAKLEVESLKFAQAEAALQQSIQEAALREKEVKEHFEKEFVRKLLDELIPKEQEIERLQLQVKELTTLAENNKQQFLEYERRMKELASSFEPPTAEGGVTTLRGIVGDLHKHVEAMRQSLQETRAQNESLQRELAAKEAEAKAQAQVSCRREQALQARDAHLQSLAVALRARQRRSCKIEREVLRQAEQMTELRRLLQMRDAQLCGLSQTVDALSRARFQMQPQMQQMLPPHQHLRHSQPTQSPQPQEQPNFQQQPQLFLQQQQKQLHQQLQPRDQTHLHQQLQTQDQPHLHEQLQQRDQPHLQQQLQPQDQPHLHQQLQKQDQPHLQQQLQPQDQPHLHQQLQQQDQPHLQQHLQRQDQPHLQQQLQSQNQQHLLQQLQPQKQPHLQQQEQIEQKKQFQQHQHSKTMHEQETQKSQNVNCSDFGNPNNYYSKQTPAEGGGGVEERQPHAASATCANAARQLQRAMQLAPQIARLIAKAAGTVEVDSLPPSAPSVAKETADLRTSLPPIDSSRRVRRERSSSASCDWPSASPSPGALETLQAALASKFPPRSQRAAAAVTTTLAIPEECPTPPPAAQRVAAPAPERPQRPRSREQHLRDEGTEEAFVFEEDDIGLSEKDVKGSDSDRPESDAPFERSNRREQSIVALEVSEPSPSALPCAGDPQELTRGSWAVTGAARPSFVLPPKEKPPSQTLSESRRSRSLDRGCLPHYEMPAAGEPARLRAGSSAADSAEGIPRPWTAPASRRQTLLSWGIVPRRDEKAGGPSSRSDGKMVPLGSPRSSTVREQLVDPENAKRTFGEKVDSSNRFLRVCNSFPPEGFVWEEAPWGLLNPSLDRTTPSRDTGLQVPTRDAPLVCSRAAGDATCVSDPISTHRGRQRHRLSPFRPIRELPKIVEFSEESSQDSSSADSTKDSGHCEDGNNIDFQYKKQDPQDRKAHFNVFSDSQAYDENGCSDAFLLPNSHSRTVNNDERKFIQSQKQVLPNVQGVTKLVDNLESTMEIQVNNDQRSMASKSISSQTEIANFHDESFLQDKRRHNKFHNGDEADLQEALDESEAFVCGKEDYFENRHCITKKRVAKKMSSDSLSSTRRSNMRHSSSRCAMEEDFIIPCVTHECNNRRSKSGSDIYEDQCSCEYKMLIPELHIVHANCMCQSNWGKFK